MPDEIFELMFRAEVKHYRHSASGIFAYFDTMKEAADWVAGWKDAVWAHIDRREQRIAADLE